MLFLTALEDAIQQAKALDENGRPFVVIADQTIADFYSSWNSSMIISEVSSQLLHDTVEQGKVAERSLSRPRRRPRKEEA